MKSNGMDSRIVEVLQILETESLGHISEQALARRVYLSPSRLRHLFKSVTGNSLREHISRSRAYTTKQLLRSTSLSIKEIASQLGFHSSRHLRRVFLHYVGCTPSSFRKSIVSVKTN